MMDKLWVNGEWMIDERWINEGWIFINVNE
jgi:hypothetical protein